MNDPTARRCGLCRRRRVVDPRGFLACPHCDTPPDNPSVADRVIPVPPDLRRAYEQTRTARPDYPAREMTDL